MSRPDDSDEPSPEAAAPGAAALGVEAERAAAAAREAVAALGALPIGVTRYRPIRDADGGVDDLEIVWRSAAAGAQYALPEALLQARTIRGFVGSDRAADFIARHARVMETRQPTRIATFHPAAPDRPLEVCILPFGDGTLSLFRAAAAGPEPVFGDDALARERFELATRASGVGVWEHWAQVDRLFWNDVTCSIFGVRPEDRSGGMSDFIERLAPGQEAMLADLARTRTENGDAARDWLIRRPDGALRWVHSRARVVARDALGAATRVIGTCQDVTDRVEAQAAAETARLRFARLLTTMSHEVRTPLNAILGMAELMERDAGDPETRRRLSVMRETGKTLIRLLNDALDHGRLDAGAVQLEQAPFSPADTARGVADGHRPAAEARGLRLETRIAREAEGLRLGDAHRVAQILHNLVGNALKFTETGAIRVALSPAAGDVLRLTVSDDGIGMTGEQAARAFEEFVQADGAVARVHGGAGLGLAIVRQLARAMGGDATLETAPGAGCAVTVTLVAPPVRRPAEGAPAPERRTPMAGLRALVADDNAINRMVLGEMLARFGVTSVEAVDGLEAVALRRAGPVDLLLLDVSMPGMDGPTALETIRADEARLGLPRAPAVACTAHALAADVAALRARGFDDCLIKPLSLEDVGAALDRALQNAPLQNAPS